MANIVLESAYDNVSDDELFESKIDLENKNNDIENRNDAINEAVDVAKSLESIAIALECSPGLEPHVANALNIAVSHMCKQIGYRKRVIPSMESFGGHSTKKQATMESVEGLKNTAIMIWEKIKATIIALGQKLKEFFKSIYDYFQSFFNNTQKEAEKQENNLGNLEDEVNEFLKKNKNRNNDKHTDTKQEDKSYKDNKTTSDNEPNDETIKKILLLTHEKKLPINSHELAGDFDGLNVISKDVLETLGYPNGEAARALTSDFSSYFRVKCGVYTKAVIGLYKEIQKSFINLSSGINKISDSDFEIKLNEHKEFVKKLISNNQLTLTIPFGNSKWYIEPNGQGYPKIKISSDPNTSLYLWHCAGTSIKSNILPTLDEFGKDSFIDIFTKQSEQLTSFIKMIINKDGIDFDDPADLLRAKRLDILVVMMSSFTNQMAFNCKILTFYTSRAIKAMLKYTQLSISNTRVICSYLQKRDGYIRDLEELKGSWF